MDKHEYDVMLLGLMHGAQMIGEVIGMNQKNRGSPAIEMMAAVDQKAIVDAWEILRNMDWQTIRTPEWPPAQ